MQPRLGIRGTLGILSINPASRSLYAMAWLAIAAPASAQFQEPVRFTSAPVLQPEKGWKAVIRRDSPERRELTFRVNAVLVAGREGGPESAQKNEFESTTIQRPGEDRDNAGRERTDRLLVMLPWVPRTATSVGLDVRDPAFELCGEEVDHEVVWVDAGPGRSPMPGFLVVVPDDLELNVDPFSGLMFDASISYTVWTAYARIDETQAKQAIWPDEWSPAFACGLADGVFLENATDPATRRVREMDLDALTQIALDLAGVTSPEAARAIPPWTLIRQVTKATCERVRSAGEAVLPKSQGMHVMNGKDGSKTSFLFNRLQRGEVFQGFEVDESLTVLRRGTGNDAERATALAAVFRRLGIPARVIVALDTTKPLPADVVIPLVDPAAPPVKQNNDVIATPAYRFWVEVGIRHRDRGEAWVPIDPGTGGNSWRIGEVRDADDLVPVATAWWPMHTVVVGSFDADMKGGLKKPAELKVIQKRPILKGRRIKRQGPPFRVRFMPLGEGSGMPQSATFSIPIRAGRIAAGGWGFATEGIATTCKWQALGITAKGGSVRAGEKPPW